MAAVVAAVATACLTIASCTVEDNAADEVDVMKEEIDFDAPAPMAMPGSYIVEAKVLGCGKNDVNKLYSQYTNAGWKVIEQDLNKGAKGKYVYLAVRMGSSLDKDQYGYITDFYLSNKNVTSFKLDGRIYTRVGKDGDQDFDGNLNSKTKNGDNIYLYYTRDIKSEGMAVTDVYFDDQQTGNGVVGKEGKSTGSNGDATFYGYDLNANVKNCKTRIYMHQFTEERTRWKLDAVATDNSKCLLNGIEGPTDGVTVFAIPITYNGVKVASCSNISALKDLQILNFYELDNFEEFPGLSGCTNLKYIYRLDRLGSIVGKNYVPDYFKTIGDRKFQNTAIESIYLSNVTEVGVDAFLGCNDLKEVGFGKAAKVGSGAFSFIKSAKCEVTYPGTSASWNQRALLCSPNVTVVGITDSNKPAYWGWCGGASEKEKNGMSWQLDVTGQETANGESVNVADLNLFCAIDSYRENQPDSQRITKFAWEAYSKDMKLENLYLKDVVSVGVYEFRGTPVRHVHLYPGLKEIGYQAFANLNTEFITYHGTQEQWDAVKKDGGWNLNTDSVSLEVTIQP